jgi:hypothetical protein
MIKRFDRKSSPRICFLLIGFNRRLLLLDNVERCKSACQELNSIYISVDGGREESKDQSIALSDLDVLGFSHLGKTKHKVKKWPANLGPDRHIPKAIDWAFQENDGVVVIEDDIKLSSQSLRDIRDLLAEQILSAAIEPIVSMSGIGGLSKAPNLWRQTPYFTAWGYGLTHGFWSLHKNQSLEIQSGISINQYMQTSKTWQKMSERKRSIWVERIERGNYDYQIQATLFKKSINVKAPVFRMSDNVGHGESSSTHTRFTAPRYLRRSCERRIYKFKGELKGQIISRLLIFVDSNTWAGDGVLSVRGRTAGVRTTLRSIALHIKRRSNNA